MDAAEGMTEDKANRVSVSQWLKGRSCGWGGVRPIVGGKPPGTLEAVYEVFSHAKYQVVAKMLKAIHAQESKTASSEKGKAVVLALREIKWKESANKIADSIEETLTYSDFPFEHWIKIRINNVIERLNREIRRRTRVVGTFPDGSSVPILVCARLHHVTATQWGNKKYMNMMHLDAGLSEDFMSGSFPACQ